jgi:DNA-binding CsgD family transcriptional regulator
MTRAAIEVVERAYRLDGDWSAWLGGMAEAAEESLGGDLGLFGIAYDARGPGMPRNFAMMATPRAAPLRRTLGAIAPGAGTDVMRDVVLHGGLASVSQILGAARLARIDGLQRAPMRDVVVLGVCDPSGVGVLLGAPRAEPTRTTRAQQGAWARVAAHVGAALRLRLALGDRPARTDGAEAVLTPDGAIVHAEAEAVSARAELREAVIARTRARTAGTHEGLAPWTALVEGRWSLVDVFESDGRRYVVARPNDPSVPDPRALSVRERQVAALAALGRSNKAIAYEMGLATSRVGTLVAHAARKLGVGSRAELVALVRGLMTAGRG